jgi:hypothetical protein
MLSRPDYPTVVVGNVTATHEAVEDQCLRACQAAESSARTVNACRTVECRGSGGLRVTTDGSRTGPGSMPAPIASRLGHSHSVDPSQARNAPGSFNAGEVAERQSWGPESGEGWNG